MVLSMSEWRKARDENKLGQSWEKPGGGWYTPEEREALKEKGELKETEFGLREAHPDEPVDEEEEEKEEKETIRLGGETETTKETKEGEQLYYVAGLGIILSTEQPFRGDAKSVTYLGEKVFYYSKGVNIENVKKAIKEEKDLAGGKDLKLFILNPDKRKIMYNVVPVGGAGGLIAGLGAKIKGIGLGAAAFLGLTTVAGVAKTTATIAGIDTLIVWLASDNILTGTAFTLRKIRDAARAGVLSQAQATAELARVRKWIDKAGTFVDASIALNPLLIPFRTMLQTNTEKAEKDFEFEERMINDAVGIAEKSHQIRSVKNDIKSYQEINETLREEKSERGKDKRIKRLKEKIDILKSGSPATDADKERFMKEDIKFLEYKLDVEEEMAKNGDKIERKRKDLEKLKGGK